MRLQIKLQQLEKSFGIEQRNGKAKSAGKTLPGLRPAWTGEGARPYTILWPFTCLEPFTKNR